MDIRNVQRTGNMLYVYLPTAWCKKFNVTGDSKVQLTMSPEGGLIISSQFQKQVPKHIEIDVDAVDLEVLNKLIVACYLNPAASFKINLKEELDYTKLLEQKKIVPLELVEIEGKQIRCESSITISEPYLLLKTMITKIKNMLIIMHKGGNKELIDRYEEEIDRDRLLIDKAIISSLTFEHPSESKPIDLYYISQIARDLERLADHVGLLKEGDTKLLDSVKTSIDAIKDIVEDITHEKGFDYKRVVALIKRVSMKKSAEFKNIQDYYKKSIKQNLENIAEVLMDWAITVELQKK